MNRYFFEILILFVRMCILSQKSREISACFLIGDRNDFNIVRLHHKRLILNFFEMQSFNNPFFTGSSENVEAKSGAKPSV